MRTYREEHNRLESIRALTRAGFSHFGVNKAQELIRLSYEISKRDDIRPHDIFQELRRSVKGSDDFDKIKNFLLGKRYPVSCSSEGMRRFYLPKVSLNRSDVTGLRKRRFYPENIFFQRKIKAGPIFKRFKGAFPQAKFKEIYDLKKYVETLRRFSITDYNRRRENVFLIEQKGDFFKKCPCTKNAAGCKYHVFNLGFGCIFECTYCFLQEYTNSPGIVLPANLDSFFDRFKRYKRRNIRIGTGEFTDSLMLDDLTCYSIPIIEFFKDERQAVFEFKTKCNNIKNLLKTDHSGNIVISWSLSPQGVIDENEFFTAPLEDRIYSACKCIAAGYKVSFHLDPVLYFDGWQARYIEMLDMIFEKIREKDIAWMSLGTLRFNPEAKLIIEKRFPNNSILDEELVYGFDSKLRYPNRIRHGIYRVLLSAIRKKYKNVMIYLCMEDRYMWMRLRTYKLGTF